jgi:hypothetical protein
LIFSIRLSLVSLPEHTTDNNSTDIPTAFQETVIEEQNISTPVSNDPSIIVEESTKRSPLEYSLSVCCSYGEGENGKNEGHKRQKSFQNSTFSLLFFLEICNQNQLIESCSSAFAGTDLKKTRDSPSHIMISYNHTTRRLCMNIAQKLRVS